MLVLVGRLSAGAYGSKKLVLLAFLFSICHLQNYEQTIILEWATQGNDDVMRSLAQKSCFCSNRGTWVRMHKNTRKQIICFLVTQKRNSVSKTPKLFRFQDTKTFRFQDTKTFHFWDTKMEFHFHSTQNKILFPLYLKWNSVSTPLETKFCFWINPNRLGVEDVDC
jgi:hypothetical protein